MQEQVEQSPGAGGPPPALRAGRSRPWTALAGAALVIVGLGLWVLYHFGTSHERHSFAHGATAPATVQVTAGRTYSIGIHGGIETVRARHLSAGDVSCEITQDGGVTTKLAIVTERADTKAVNQLATFVSPVSGRVHVGCAGLPPVFVDNAVGAGTDWAGTSLLLATASLAVGVPLLVSAFRRPRPVR